MADNDKPIDMSGFDAAIAEAKKELGAMHTQASADDTLEEIDGNFTLHDVEGVGRYAIADDDGWYMLAALISDPELKLQFSTERYPVFDALIVGRNAELTPEISENLAAVRNAILLHYFAATPEGMSTEKAVDAISRIAMFTGNGLARGAKAVSEEEKTAPGTIEPEIAALPDGVGARYIYEKILDAQRQSDWLRPFASLTSLFGGKPLIDWKLPQLNETPFRELEEEHKAQLMAEDLEALSEHLLTTAARMQNVQSLSESVRQDAIEIAKEILRKLKIKLGKTEVLDGLALDPENDKNDELGGLAGVAMIFELLLAWAHGIDASLLQHPTVQAAIRAVGQLGYICKMESLRLATLAGQRALTERLQKQMQKMPKNMMMPPKTNFGDLIDRVQQGIDTVLNQVVEIKGPNALVGHTPAKQLGNYMSATPIAGLSMLGSSTGTNRSNTGKENAAIQQSMELALRAQAARISSQLSSRQQQTVSRSATGRQALQQARAAQQRQQAMRYSTHDDEHVPPGMQNQMAQRAMMMRNASMRNLYGHHDEEDPHHNPTQAVVSKMDPRILQSVRASMNVKGVNPGQLMNSGMKMQMQPPSQGYGLRPAPTPNLKQNPPTPPQQQQPVQQQPAQQSQQRPQQSSGTTQTPPAAPAHPDDRQPLPLPPTNKPSGGGGGGRGF